MASAKYRMVGVVLGNPIDDRLSLFSLNHQPLNVEPCRSCLRHCSFLQDTRRSTICSPSSSGTRPRACVCSGRIRAERRAWRELREGVYLLRTDLPVESSAELCSRYTQLIEAEAASRAQERALRPALVPSKGSRHSFSRLCPMGSDLRARRLFWSGRASRDK